MLPGAAAAEPEEMQHEGGAEGAKRTRVNTDGNYRGGAFYNDSVAEWGGDYDGPYRGDGSRLARCELAVSLLLKQETINTLQLRRLRAVAFRTWMIPTESSFFKAMEQAKAEYIKGTEGKQGHNLGLLDYHLFAALVRAVEEAGGLETEGELVREHRELFTAPLLYKNKLKHGKLGAAYDSKVRRLEISAVEAFAPLIDVLAVSLERAEIFLSRWA